MNKVTFASVLLIVLLTVTFGLDSVYGQFSIRGNVTEADGTAVGGGYTVKAVNLYGRKNEGRWFIYGYNLHRLLWGRPQMWAIKLFWQ